MGNLIFTRISLVWLLLVGATAMSWELGHGFGVHDVRTAGAMIIAIAFIKVFFVIMEFMEIRGAPLFMRAVGVAWLVVVCSVLVTLQLGTPY